LPKPFRLSIALGVVLKLAVRADQAFDFHFGMLWPLVGAIEFIKSLQHLQSKVPKHF
jgi:hypothetical protein